MDFSFVEKTCTREEARQRQAWQKPGLRPLRQFLDIYCIQAMPASEPPYPHHTIITITSGCQASVQPLRMDHLTSRTT